MHFHSIFYKVSKSAESPFSDGSAPLPPTITVLSCLSASFSGGFV